MIACSVIYFSDTFGAAGKTDEMSTDAEQSSKKRDFRDRGDSPRRVLQHRHTCNTFISQESLSKEEARKRMLSWRKTTKLRKTTTPIRSASSHEENCTSTDKTCSNFGARKRGIFIGSKKSHSMVQY